MVALRLATFWLALLAPAVLGAARTDDPRVYQVSVDELEVMTEPSDSAYATSSLHRGDRVVVLGEDGDWATIRPPAGTFDWIDATEVRDGPNGTLVVGVKGSRVRYAAVAAKLPGPPSRTLPPGATVSLLDHSELQVGRGSTAQVWRAIEPAGTEVRYLRLDSLQRAAPVQPLRPSVAKSPERLVSYEPEAPDADLPPEVNAELASIAALNRSIKGGSLESWDLTSVRSRYESLLRQYGSNTQVKAAIQPRLDQAIRDHDLGAKAQEFARLLRASEGRDSELAQIQRTVDRARISTERNYDAQGLLQASSRRYRGQKVYALIGPEGKPISYLTIPPGVPVNRFLARRIGVRGIVHFDEGLGARLIAVRDLDLIEKAR